MLLFPAPFTPARTWMLQGAGSASAANLDLALLACRSYRRAAKDLRRGVEGRGNAFLRLACLHRGEQIVETVLQITKARFTIAGQRLEILEREDDHTRSRMLRDDNRPAGRSLVENRPGLVLQAARGNALDVDQLSAGIAVFQRVGHGIS